MTNKWLEIRLSVPDEAVDLVSQMLVELGSTGITAAERILDTFVPPNADELKNDPILKAYFAPEEQTDHLTKAIEGQLRSLSSLYPELSETVVNCKQIDGQDWANNWKQHFQPFHVGQNLIIKPSWSDSSPAHNEKELILDPGQAFGTGTHATTSLCLDAIADHFESGRPPQNVLDVGTGSGILAMACAALGADKVLATDIDPTACEIARNNIARNNLGTIVTVTDLPLENFLGQFDLVLANILASENIRLAKELVTHLRPKGRLVLSGILIEQEQQVLDGFALQPLNLLTTVHRDEWTCMVYKRHE